MSLTITHSCGFFSCCSVKLKTLTDYFNYYNTLPVNLNCSKQFHLYKRDPHKDVTFDFFQYQNIPIINKINYCTGNQFIDYKKLDFKNIIPFIKMFFEPSQMIKNISSDLIKKYNICPEKCIALYYRGTDKRTETPISSFQSFYDKLSSVIQNDSDVQILLQTDSTHFLDFIKPKNLKNVIIINELVTSHTMNGVHNEHAYAFNHEQMKYFLATILIIAQCKHIITGSGNVSIWAMFYRGHADGVFQFLSDRWLY